MFLRQYAFRFAFLLTIFIAASSDTYAQPNLPDMANVTQNGINILTWTCQYDGVKSIAVQRSNDSNFNYITIGYVKDVKKGVQYYLDGHSKAGVNWYRLKLVFGSDLSWTSNRIKVMVDSAQIAKGRVLPSNDSLQGLASKMSTKKVEVSDSANGITGKKAVVVTTTLPKPKDTLRSPTDTVKPKPKPVLTIEIPDIDNVNAYTYIKSQYVFTNPFTGHVNIEIADAKTSRYSLEFYDSKNVRILEIPKIGEPNIVLDKRNFQRVGMYRFELYKEKVKLETGYVTIY